MILMTQKKSVTSGTLLSILRVIERPTVAIASLATSCTSRRCRRQPSGCARLPVPATMSRPTSFSHELPLEVRRQGARDHGAVLGHQDPDDRHGRVRLGLPRPAACRSPARSASSACGSRCGCSCARRRYRAPVYWFAVLMVAVFGTMAADGVHDGASLPYASPPPSTPRSSARSSSSGTAPRARSSIHCIDTPRRERFYWGAVLATFALGTAAGDLTAMPLNLGFFDSGAAVRAGSSWCPARGWWKLGLNPVVGFWASYVVTRPLGASFADWFGKPVSQTGLGLGDGTVTGLALIVFIALVAYTAIARNDIQGRRPVRSCARSPPRARRRGGAAAGGRRRGRRAGR